MERIALGKLSSQTNQTPTFCVKTATNGGGLRRNILMSDYAQGILAGILAPPAPEPPVLPAMYLGEEAFQ